MSLELLSLTIIVGWALIVIALERAFPYDKQPFFREGFFNDFVMYSLVQSYFMGIAIKMLIEYIDGSTGWSRLHIVSDWPLWVQCTFFFFVHDFYIYWFHRLQHASNVLWRTHEAHHSVEQIDWVAGSRSHPIEIMINQTIEFAPIVLLGAAPEVAIFKATIDAVWGMWIHSNIDVRTGPFSTSSTVPKCTAGTTVMSCRCPVRTSPPRLRRGIGFSARPTCRNTSRAATASGAKTSPMKVYDGQPAPGLLGRITHIARVCWSDARVYVLQCAAMFRPFGRTSSNETP